MSERNLLTVFTSSCSWGGGGKSGVLVNHSCRYIRTTGRYSRRLLESRLASAGRAACPLRIALERPRLLLEDFHVPLGALDAVENLGRPALKIRLALSAHMINCKIHFTV